ncbi:MAG: hypothetical protein ACI9GW_000009 [Halieaceae bacterium]|jgi:hypothetical protein
MLIGFEIGPAIDMRPCVPVDALRPVVDTVIDCDEGSRFLHWEISGSRKATTLIYDLTGGNNVQGFI